jgi:tetratricopeptide (TPR) repeat protein
MDVIFGLFDNQLFLILLGLGVVFFLYQKFAHRVKVRGPAGSFSKDAILSKLLGSRYAEGKLLRQVNREKKAGNVLAAGKLLEDAGKHGEAVEAYISGSEFWAAASGLERMGKIDRAAETFLQAGDYKKAAQLFTDSGKPARAAALFQEKGNNLEAARLYGVAQSWDKAAELYVKSGYPLRAAEAYERKGDFLKAAEAYEKHFMENVSFGTTYSSTAVSVDQKSALLAGRLYEKAQDLNHAQQVYIKGGYFKEAAAASMKLNLFPKAAELFLRAEDPGSAAEAFERAGDPEQAANLRGEVALKADRIPEAAANFQKGRDYLRAAELYESVSLYAEAAGAYEAGESYAAAGSVYIRAGLKDRAADAYARGGEFETAAKLYEECGDVEKAVSYYEKAGLTFKSGEAAAKAGERDKAIALLQRVGPKDDQYGAATEILAQLFIDTQMPGLAVERLQKVLAGQAVTSQNLDLYYLLGVALEAAGNGGEALHLYQKILSEDLRYKDVETRVARLQGGSTTSPPAPPIPVKDAPLASAAAPGSPPPPPRAAPPQPAAPKAGAPGAPAKRFVTKEELGRGPLGVLLRGEDRVDGRSVALRALPPEALSADGLLHALVSDLKAAAQLSHPNLVKVLGLVDVAGRRCVVSELVTGRNLGEALKAGHRMPFSQVHSLARVLTQLLSFIHGKGLVHASIQPSNIMVAGGVVKVADLGLGRLVRIVVPDGEYRAPENAFDAVGDIYAAAAVLYHLLTGVNPKKQPQGTGLPLPSKLAPGVPEAFDKILIRCLHPRPELRFGSADEILQELKGMVHIG